MKAAAYTRVSTIRKVQKGDSEDLIYDQNPKIQEQALTELAKGRGWELYKVYTDRASGAKESRPALDQLMADAKRGLFQVVVVWKFDRFARSLKQLVTALDEFRNMGIDFVSYQEAVDTRTPAGKAMFGMIAIFAEFERSIIQERVRAGIDYAQQHGTKSGREFGRPRKVWPRGEADKLRKKGIGTRAIARALKVPETTIRAHFRGAQKVSPQTAR